MKRQHESGAEKRKKKKQKEDARASLAVTPRLHSIFFHTKHGKTFVTCIVFGDPLPTLTWVEPDTAPSPHKEQLSAYAVLSSIQAQDLNTTYTCQINTTLRGIQNLSVVPYTSVTSPCKTQDLVQPASNSQCNSTCILVLLVALGIFIVLTAVATGLVIFFWKKAKTVKEAKAPSVEPTYSNVMPPRRREQRTNVYKE